MPRDHFTERRVPSITPPRIRITDPFAAPHCLSQTGYGPTARNGLQRSIVSLRIQCLTIDSHDPKRLATFWAEVLGWRLTYDEADEVVLEPPEGSAECDVCPDLLFIRVSDDKTVKNRLHLDLRPADQDIEIERVLGLGASRVDIGQDGSESWTVLADPEGNEFCILRALSPEELSSS
jgi:hypothetical protein